MARIRFKNPEWAGFSSYMGTVKFVDGVSEGDVNEFEIRLLGSITAIEIIEADGSVRDAGLGQENVDLRSVPAPDVTMPAPEGVEGDFPEEIIPAPVEITLEPEIVQEKTDTLEEELKAAVADMEEDVRPTEVVVANKLWTREELEAIADEDGIKGIRIQAGDPLGVKNNSIDGLIEEILAAQAKAVK